MHTAWSARRAASPSRSTSEVPTTVSSPSSSHAFTIRSAISPRLATNTRLIRFTPAPPGTAAARTRPAAAFSGTTSAIVPDTPAGTEFIIFMTSMMQTIVSGSTRCPTSTNGGLPGRLGAVERPQHRGGDRGRVRPPSPARRVSAWLRSADWDRSRPGGRLRRPARPLPRSPLTHVQRETLGLQAELGQVRLVDDPQDLADVFVGERHRQSFGGPAPNVLMISDIADAGLGFSGFLASPVTGRAWTTNSSPASPRGQRPLDVLMAAEVPLDALADVDQAARALADQGTRASRRSAGTSTRTAPAPLGSGTYSTSLAWTCSRTTSPVTLLTRKSSGSDLAADHREPEPPARVDRDHARIAADRVAGEHHARHLGVDHQLHGDPHRRRLVRRRRVAPGS